LLAFLAFILNHRVLSGTYSGGSFEREVQLLVSLESLDLANIYTVMSIQAMTFQNYLCAITVIDKEVD